jgi:hypothetical protein
MITPTITKSTKNGTITLGCLKTQENDSVMVGITRMVLMVNVFLIEYKPFDSNIQTPAI